MVSVTFKQWPEFTAETDSKAGQNVLLLEEAPWDWSSALGEALNPASWERVLLCELLSGHILEV